MSRSRMGRKKRESMTLPEEQLVLLEQALENMPLSDEEREALRHHFDNVVAPAETPMELGQFVFLIAQMHDVSIREAYQVARQGYRAGKLKLMQ